MEVVVGQQGGRLWRMGGGLARMDRQGFWDGGPVIAASTHKKYGLD